MFLFSLNRYNKFPGHHKICVGTASKCPPWLLWP